MAWNPTLNPLQSILAELYPADDDVRRLANQAGLPPAYIDFDGPAIQVWHSLLEQAQQRGRVQALIEIVQGEYPENQPLTQAIQAYDPETSAQEMESPKLQKPSGEGASAFSRLNLPRLACSVQLVVSLGVVLLVSSLVFAYLADPFAWRPKTATPTFVSSNTPTPEPQTITSPTDTYTPSPEPTPTYTLPPTLTPWPTPVLVVAQVYELEYDTELIEYTYEEGIFSSEVISDFLRLEKVEWVFLDPGVDETPGFDLTLRLTNVGKDPLLLDLDERFFRLEDDLGNQAELVYFCCTARGSSLSPGQSRAIRLVFRFVPGWLAKSEGSPLAYLVVRGLQPVLSARWQIMLPAVAE